MRILQVVSRFDFGGAENYVRELSNQLQKSNHQVFILSQNGRQQKLLETGILFTTVPFLFKLVFLRALLYIYYVKKFQIETIHAHQRLPILAASLAGWITGVPVVATVHGRVRYDLRSWFSRKIPSRFIFVSRQVLNISQYKKQLERRSIVIPNGINIEHSHCQPEPFHLGYICRLDSKHIAMVKMLMEIMPLMNQKYQHVKLSIIGEGKDLKLVHTWAESINRQAGRCMVMVHGYLNHADQQVIPIDLVVGVGRVAIGAAMAGCAVVSANNNRMGELITSANYDFYLHNNFVNINGHKPTTESLYRVIDHYCQNRNQLHPDVERVSTNVNNDCHWSRIADQVLTVYRQASKP